MKKNLALIPLIMLFWFVISFITNILGPLIPDIIDNFSLTHLALAGFIPMSFFLAYGVMSIPAGILIERFSQKAVLVAGFTMPMIGSLLFALNPSYVMLLCSSFIIGLGMAMLQTVINPLTRTVGGEENFAFFSVMGQLVFGAASFVSPLVYVYLVGSLTGDTTASGYIINLLSDITPDNMPWVALYWLFTAILVVIIAIVFCVRFPRVELQQDERAGSATSYGELFKMRIVYLFFFGIFSYVATEQGIANWISEFMRTYHGYNPQADSAVIIGSFWGLMSLGCLFGLLILRLFNSKSVLKVATMAAIVMLVTALLAPAGVAAVAFALIGFSISVIFSIVMSLGLNSADKHHGSFAGILCSGIVGGAVGPLVVGWLGDIIGLRGAMMIIIIPLLYLFSIGFWAKPLVENKTVRIKDLFKTN